MKKTVKNHSTQQSIRSIKELGFNKLMKTQGKTIFQLEMKMILTQLLISRSLKKNTHNTISKESKKQLVRKMSELITSYSVMVKKVSIKQIIRMILRKSLQKTIESNLMILKRTTLNLVTV